MPEIQIHPCNRHRSLLSNDLPWERALDIADACPSCRVEVEAAAS
ncbi:hypothetical protein [Agromyces bauzanensis]